MLSDMLLLRLGSEAGVSWGWHEGAYSRPLLLVVGAAGFFVLLMRGSESILVYPLARLMYVGLGLALYAISTFWTDGEE
jgi:hypothetical protein